MTTQNGAASAGSNDSIEHILDAAAEHDIPQLRKLLPQSKLLDCESVDVQDAKGRSPLHAAIAACDSLHPPERNSELSVSGQEGRAADTVKFLLEEGAIWNQLDANNETPGCVAYRLQLHDLYQIMVDAGVRAEILLNRLEGYAVLEDESDEEAAMQADNANSTEIETSNAPEMADPTSTGSVANTKPPSTEADNSNYLASRLVFTSDKLVDEQQNGVMMEWESNIMKTSVDLILDRPGLKILNVGAGMMIFDSFVQASKNAPLSHHIIEAHPDVLANIEAEGWHQKPGVVVHAGRWQDVLPQLIASNETFDAIFYDTFAESYSDFREFFTENVLALLNSDGKWSFFNGMGADRQISYDVYQKVVEMDLFEAAFDVEWQDVDIPVLDREWEGVKRKYWNVKRYRLPLCKFMD